MAEEKVKCAWCRQHFSSGGLKLGPAYLCPACCRGLQIVSICSFGAVASVLEHLERPKAIRRFNELPGRSV